MPKSVKGSPEVDRSLEQWLEQTDKIWRAPDRVSKNLSQKMLRDIIFRLNIIKAHCDKHLDYRNEQGRGGLKR